MQGKDFMCLLGCADVRVGIVVDATCCAALCTRSAWLHSCARSVCVCVCVLVCVGDGDYKDADGFGRTFLVHGDRIRAHMHVKTW